MSLQSKLLRGDPKLEAAAISNPDHITPGARGDHVAKIQQALNLLDNTAIAVDGRYGPITAHAVLAYKRKRDIVNRANETQADDIVGKMTMASLDRELVALENDADACTLTSATPDDVPAPSASRRLILAFAAPAGGAPAGAPSDAAVMQRALQDSRQTVGSAINTLTTLAGKLQLGNEIMTDDEKKALAAAIVWLRIDPAPLTPEKKRAIAATIRRAVDKLQRSLLVKTSKGADPELTRTATKSHAETFGNPDLGVHCGVPFFTVDGPNCRRDVITHEFLHFVGAHHGGGPLGGATIRHNIVTTEHALDSADNLAQMVAEITTPGGKTDACARAGE
jgi:peptidoglycan hydrolase-like protein with peptidoglycan-binding domain